MNYSDSYSKLILLLSSIGIISYIAKGVFGIDNALYLAFLVGTLLCTMMLLSPVPKLLAIYIFIALLGTTFLVLNNGLSSGRTYLPLIISSIGIALGVSRTINSHFKYHYYFSAILFFCMCFYFLTQFAIFRNFDFALAGSRNHVSTNLLLSSCYYVIVRRWNEAEISALYPVLVFVISIFAVGISGIISSLILLLGYFLTRSTKTILFTSACLLAPILLIDWISFFQWIDDDLLRKIMYKLVDGDIRYDIFYDYVARLDILTFITGVPLDQIEWNIAGRNDEVIVSYNLHSSYLLLHTKVGFLSLFIMLGLVFILFKLIKKDFIVFILFLAIIVRASTDTIAFSHGNYEWALILVLLYAVDRKGMGRGWIKK